MKPKVAVIQFPGNNCERETKLALERNGMQAVDVLWFDRKLEQYDAYVLAGGFSYEDRCRSGAIAARDQLMQAIIPQAQQGKPVLGLCNGAQTLIESGLVPGYPDGKAIPSIALLPNRRARGDKVIGTGYYNTWCHIKPNNQTSAFSARVKQPLNVPIAHVEGRFAMPPRVLTALKKQGASLWFYCDPAGKVRSEFPTNPNGSLFNLAAVGNASGNVLAMMPHPERSAQGDAIFASMHDYIRAQKLKFKSVEISPPAVKVRKPSTNKKQKTCVVRLNYNDNTASSVQQAFLQMGLKAKLQRYQWWAMDGISNDDFSALKRGYEICNHNRATLITELEAGNYFLVRNDVDAVAQHKQKILKERYQLSSLNNLQYGVLWQIEADKKTLRQIIDSRLLCNPAAQKIYSYPATSD